MPGATTWLGCLARWLAPPAASGPFPTAFASLETMSEEGFVTFDRVTRREVAWSRVKRITAAMGRQQYDMTICLTVDHRGGKTVFLPETHPDWDAFLDTAERTLPAMSPRADWTTLLADDPDATVRVYPARC